MRYRHVWPGVLLLASLALLLAALLVWGDHFLSPGPTGGIARLLELWARPRDQEALAAQASSPILPAAGTEPSPPRSEQPDGAGPATAAAPVDPDDAQILPRSEPGTGPRSGNVSPPRYWVELGTFALVEDAERTEAQLNQAGFSTVRFRQRESAGPGRVGQLTLRHGTFSSRQEAEAAAREMARLGISPEVVQVR